MRIIPQPLKIKENTGFSSLRKINEYILDTSIRNDEAYRLEISANSIKAYARTMKGHYYARVTLRQLCTIYNEVPCCVIEDSPRYEYRGFMIDCARHMFTVKELEKMIDAASLVKFNKFHWHLSDDQGFRIELTSAPELTKKGSIRKGDNFGLHCRSDEPYGGYYTKAEIKHIIDFCAERYIEVIPEFDMPGHLSALLHVYPEYSCEGKEIEIKDTNGIFKDVLCVGNNKAVEFMKTLISEVCSMFPGKYIHIGGDEAPRDKWKKCELCQTCISEKGLKNEDELQSWFINEMAETIKSYNKIPVVWNDCLKGKNLSSSVIIEHWLKGPGGTSKVANNGQKVISAPFTPFYCDYPYGMHSLKDVYKYEPDKFKGLNDKGRSSIIGVESPVWTEFINNNDRLEYMCFPRWFAVAECAWTDKRNKQYSDFEKVSEKLCDYLNSINVTTAPKADWNKMWLSRIRETSRFFSDAKKKK